MLNDMLKNPLNENIIGDFDTYLYPLLKLNISSLMILQDNESEDSIKLKRSQLNETQIAQPAILLHSILNYYKFLNEKREEIQSNSLKIDSVFGPSLGEIIALVASESLSLNEAGILLYNRGRFMQESCPIGTGSMLNIVGDINNSKEIYNNFIADLSHNDNEMINISSINSKRLLVISGRSDLIDKCNVFIKKNSIATRKLQVSAAFHSALMKKGQEMFKKYLDEADIKFELPVFRVLSTIEEIGDINDVVYSNNKVENIKVLAYDIKDKDRFDLIVKDMLVKQYTHPINLIECVKYNYNNHVRIYDVVKRKYCDYSDYL